MKIHGRPPPGLIHKHLELALDRVVVPLHDRRRISTGASVVVDDDGTELVARDVLEHVHLSIDAPVDVAALTAVAERLAASLPRYASPVEMLPPVWDWDVVDHPPQLRVTFWARVAG